MDPPLGSPLGTFEWGAASKKLPPSNGGGEGGGGQRKAASHPDRDGGAEKLANF